MKTKTKRLTALVLALSLLLTACGGGGATAATMHLRKTQGTVGVSDGEGKDVQPREDLGLYSGYGVDTRAESYAWIDLDDVKLTKLDQDSEIQIEKEGKALTVNVVAGSLFFNVTEPLEEDETLDIVTSTMLVGIRGTCGWVTEDTAALLEGTVEVTAGEQAVTVNAGEMAVLTEDGTLEVRPFAANDVPAFVAEELTNDEDLNQAVLDATGLNIPAYSMASYEELLSTLENVVYSEIIDFEQDGSPEMLIVYLEDFDSIAGPSKKLGVEIYRNGTDGPQRLTGGLFSASAVEQVVCALVESNGRLFVSSCIKGNSNYVQYWTNCFGSLAEREGDPRDWGNVDSFTQVGGDYFRFEGMVSALPHNERGFVVNGGNYGENADAGKYTLVRVLYEWSI